MTVTLAPAGRSVDRAPRLWHWRPSAVLRWSPVLVVLALLLTLANTDDLDSYWLAVSVRATIGIVVVAPGLAATCAWEAGRWRRWSAAAAGVRSPAALARPTLAAAAVVAVAALAVTTAVLAPEAFGAPGGPHLGALATAVLVVLAHACAGYAVGTVLPRSVAVPLALGVSFAWLAYPPALEPFWLRNVTGNLGTSCCDLDATLPARALLAPALVACTVVTGALLVVVAGERRVRPVAVTAAVALAGLGLAVARPLVDEFGPDPVVPRRVAMTCDRSTSVAVCAFPEHADLLARAVPVVEDVVGRMERVGLATPRTVTEASTTDTATWSVRLDAPSEDLFRRLLAGQPLVDVPPACSGSQPWPAAELAPRVEAYLAVAAGLPAETAAAALDETEAGRLADVLAGSRQEQAAWVAAALDAVHSCGPVPAGL